MTQEPPLAKMSSRNEEETPPHGLSWGEEEVETKVIPVRGPKPEEVTGLFATTQAGAAGAPGFFPSSAPAPSGKPLHAGPSRFAKTQTGSVAALLPPPAAVGEDTIAQLFGGPPVAAPAMAGDEGMSEAELSWLEARQKRDLLNDRISSAAAAGQADTLLGLPTHGRAPSVRPTATHAQPTPINKATLVGSFGLQIAAREPDQAAARAAATQRQPMAAAESASTAAKSGVRSLAATAPAPGTVPAKASATPARGKKALEPPPPPAAARAQRKTSGPRAIVVSFGVLLAATAAGLAGARAGLYDLPPSAAAMLSGTGLLKSAQTRTLATTPVKAAPARVVEARPALAPAAKPGPVAAVPVAVVAAAPAPTAEIPAPALAPKPAVVEAQAAASAPAASVAEAAPQPELAPEPRVQVPVAPQDDGASADAASLIESARRKLDAGDAAAAEVLMRGLLTAEPDEHHAMAVLVRALINQGRAQEALTYIDVIIKKRTRRAAYRILQGDAKSQLGDHHGAQLAWRSAQKLDPANRELVQRLGVD